MGADDLAPNRHQAICTHHADSVPNLVLHALSRIDISRNFQSTKYGFDRFGVRQLVGFFIIKGFTFSGRLHSIYIAREYAVFRESLA